MTKPVNKIEYHERVEQLCDTTQGMMNDIKKFKEHQWTAEDQEARQQQLTHIKKDARRVSALIEGLEGQAVIVGQAPGIGQ